MSSVVGLFSKGVCGSYAEACLFQRRWSRLACEVFAVRLLSVNCMPYCVKLQLTFPSFFFP